MKIVAKYSVTGFKKIGRPWRFPFQDCQEVGMQFFVPHMNCKKISPYKAYAQKVTGWTFKAESGARIKSGAPIRGVLVKRVK